MRTAAGYRVFTEQAIRRLTLVRTARRFGFSLREISAFFRTRDAGGRPCETVREAAAQMLTTIDAEIGALQAKRRQVRRTLRRWDDILARTPPDGRAFLLESLAPALNRRRHLLRIEVGHFALADQDLTRPPAPVSTVAAP